MIEVCHDPPRPGSGPSPDPGIRNLTDGHFHKPILSVICRSRSNGRQPLTPPPGLSILAATAVR